MTTKNNISIVSKIGLSLTALAVVASIVPNSQLVFGYGSSSGSAPTCGDSKPSSAPTLLSAVPTGANTVRLTWSKAGDPVTYYLLTFGTSPGEQAYGNPNVGGTDSTSYTVGGLSGGTRYYFKLRAGNTCMPGDYSNEVSAVPGGGFVNTLPAGFAAGVLGTTTEEETVASPAPSTTTQASIAPSTSVEEQPINTGNTNLSWWQKIVRFIKGLFGGK